MRAHGVDLPDPIRSSAEGYDPPASELDLTKTGIDTSTQAWNRAAFVTCFQGDPSP